MSEQIQVDRQRNRALLLAGFSLMTLGVIQVARLLMDLVRPAWGSMGIPAFP